MREARQMYFVLVNNGNERIRMASTALNKHNAKQYFFLKQKIFQNIF